MTCPEEIPKLNESGEDDSASITLTLLSNTPDEVAVYDEGEFKDGAAFNTVDEKDQRVRFDPHQPADGAICPIAEGANAV